MEKLESCLVVRASCQACLRRVVLDESHGLMVEHGGDESDGKAVPSRRLVTVSP